MASVFNVDSAVNDETQPLLSKGASSSTRRISQRWPIVLAVLLVCTVIIGGFLLGNIFDSSNSDDDEVHYGDDDHTYEFWSGGSYRECLEYDDDTYFTAEVCGGFDRVPCFVTNSLAGEGCVNSTWCDYFCGDMCALGEGALCFFEKLDNLTSTCKKVKEIIQGSIVISNTRRLADTSTIVAYAAAAVERSGIFGESAAMELLGYGLHDDAQDEGCWAHSYCRYCTTDFCRNNMSNYLIDEYGNALEGASVTDFKYGMEHINETCIAFGYDVYGDDDW